jgi:hypothetical protein
MRTILTIAALAVLFPLVFRFADKLSESVQVTSAMKKLHLL